jgi:protein-tyrosine phosphatase
VPSFFSNPLRFLRPERADPAILRPSGVLIVCTGNVCRSPMAEALLRQLVTHRAPGTRVESAGLAAPAGQPADPLAVTLMTERGIDITGHRARQISAKLVQDFPLVLVMEEAQKALATGRFRAARERTHRLCDRGSFDVPDPIGVERLDFERALVLIDQGLADWVERLWPKVSNDLT